MLADGITAATEDQIIENESKFDECDQKELAVRQAIYASISDRRLIGINLPTTSEMWRKLRELDERRSEMAAVDKRTTLQSLKCETGQDVRIHLSEMVRLREELAGMGAPVADTIFSAMLLSSLPLSYRTMVSSMMTIARESTNKLTPDTIISHITAEVEFNEALNRKPSKVENSALFVKPGGKKKGGKRGGKGKDRGFVEVLQLSPRRSLGGRLL
jgi:hypothetical protein